MNNQAIENRPNKPTRVYNKIKDLEQYKEFIQARFKAGERHKVILRALKNQMGVDFGESRLKRALEKWGASKANLTKSRKAHIQKVVKERYRGGKADARVKFTLRGRGKRLIEDNIDEILNMPDITGPELDPVGMELCTPTPGASTGREERNTPTKEQILAARPNDGPESSQMRDSGDHPDATIIDGDIEIPFGEARKANENGDGIGDEEEYEEEEEEEFVAPDQLDEELIGPNPHGPEGTDEQLQQIIARGFKALGTQNTAEIDLDDDLVESITSEGDSEYELSDDDSDYSDDYSKGGMLDWDSPMLRRYARRYKHKYEASVRIWENQAKYMIDRMQIYIIRGFSPKEASNMASRENEEQHGLHLPYEVCLNILQGNNIDDQRSGRQEEKDKEKVEDPDGKDLILCVERLFSYFMANSEDSFDDLIAFEHDSFTKSIIHLPRLILEYGPRSFLVAHSIKAAFFIFADYDFEFFGDRLSPLADHSIKIFEEIGMGDNTYTWDSRYFKLDICSGRDKVLERLSRCYGESHPILVWRHIHEAKLIALKKNRSDSDREAFDKLLAKIGYNVHYCCQNFAVGPGIIDIFVGLWGLANCLCSSAATKQLRSALQNCLAVFERPMGVRACDDQTDYLSTAIAMCMFSLGAACSRAGDFGTSLEIFIKGHGMFVESHAIEYRQNTVIVLENICQVADTRGPVLYLSLQPAFVSTHKRLSGPTRRQCLRQRRTLRKLWNKYKAYENKALQEEYSKIISHRPPSRASTPDLRSYHYYEAVKDWVNSQGGGDYIVTDINLGGQIMEMDDIEMGADMTDEMSVEQELQMITQRYIQAEAVGLVDASGRFPF
ncbi:hypothetical protein TWF679_008165 [Orbilia oligospora]|uniref:Clr5 domain-containing protein n=1 Tax=Orbilia oligospora TaxID=2813651 RepID=A0A8H8V5T4_ORBOL|nr:hypothetical protein TWF679_008165 [Orbilia oligospora]